MKWIPSFSKLLVLGAVGFVLYMGAAVYLVKAAATAEAQPGFYQLVGVVRLAGLALTIIAPLLMVLRFFQGPEQRP